MINKYEKLLELAKPYLEKNSLGIAHTERVLEIAKSMIGIPEDLCEETLALITLHDVGGSTIKEQYEIGPKRAAELMRDVGFSQEIIKNVCEMIAVHHQKLEWSSEQFKILYDADHLVMLSPEEFDHYDSKILFNWRKIISQLYYDKSKKIAEEMLNKRKSKVKR